jgi:hypothetical protein
LRAETSDNLEDELSKREKVKMNREKNIMIKTKEKKNGM